MGFREENKVSIIHRCETRPDCRGLAHGGCDKHGCVGAGLEVEGGVCSTTVVGVDSARVGFSAWFVHAGSAKLVGGWSPSTCKAPRSRTETALR